MSQKSNLHDTDGRVCSNALHTGIDMSCHLDPAKCPPADLFGRHQAEGIGWGPGKPTTSDEAWRQNLAALTLHVAL